MALRGFVAIIGGADPEDPLDLRNKARHLAVGSLIIAIAMWAFVASLLAFHSNFHGPWLMAAVGAGLLASVVFLFDVIITVVPLKDTTFRSRVKVVLIRGMLSLGVGVIVAHATILFIYRDTLAAIVTETNNKHVAQITKDTTGASQWTPVINQAEAQITKDRDQVKAEDAALADAQQRLDQLKKAWESDAVCVNGNRAANGDVCGPGTEANVLKRAYETYRDVTLPPIQENHDTNVTALRADIEKQNKTLNDANDKRSQEVVAATNSARNDVGVQAQNDALRHLLATDWTAWLWPVFFFLIDIAVAFMKGALPESDFDRRRRLQAPLNDLVAAALTKPLPPAAASPHLAAVLEHAAAKHAEVVKAAIDRQAERQLTALQRGGGPGFGLFRDRRRAAFAGSVLLLVAALVVGLVSARGKTPATDQSDPGMVAIGGQSLQLRDGMTLTVPQDAISGNVPVTASYVSPAPWVYHTAMSVPVEFTTSGRLIGKPQLSIAVPQALQQQAGQGALQLAFKSDDPSGWTAYPTSYDPATHTLTSELVHFSTWQFWTWDWIGLGADISQTLGQLTGRRASEAAECASNHPTPAWFNTEAGITNEPAMVIRSCLQGHSGDILDVQLVNNRPYGLMLYYGGAPIDYGWHEEPGSLPDAFRNLIGDLSVSDGRGLYLPPLSRASVGIKNIGNGKFHEFEIAPSPATVTADVFGVLADKMLGRAIGQISHKYISDVFGAAAATHCTQMVIGLDHGIPDRSTLYKWLTGSGVECVKDILVIAGRKEIQRAAGMDLVTIGKLSDWIGKLTTVMVNGWPDVINKAGDVLDFLADQRYAAVASLGFGFSILAHYTYTEPDNANTSKKSSGAPASKTPATQRPEPAATTQRPEPAPTATVPPPVSRPGSSARVTGYDNYGPVTTAGTAMCAGNPNRPESMPSGTVTQTFTVGAGVAYLDTATVQIDPNSSMTVHATLSVNGNEQASNDQTPTGDTAFNFDQVPVHPGDQVTLTLTWSGTAGKLDTIYTTGTPPNSHLKITNTCSDYGSPHITDTVSTGLRATISGWTM